jgi:hypothetical protein
MISLPFDPTSVEVKNGEIIPPLPHIFMAA